MQTGGCVNRNESEWVRHSGRAVQLPPGSPSKHIHTGLMDGWRIPTKPVIVPVSWHKFPYHLPPSFMKLFTHINVEYSVSMHCDKRVLKVSAQSIYNIWMGRKLGVHWDVLCLWVSDKYSSNPGDQLTWITYYYDFNWLPGYQFKTVALPSIKAC